MRSTRAAPPSMRRWRWRSASGRSSSSSSCPRTRREERRRKASRGRCGYACSLVYYRSVAINREKILGEAMKYAEQKRYDKAIAELRKITDADPSDVRALQKVGDFQLKVGALTEAIDTYEGVAKLYA